MLCQKLALFPWSWEAKRKVVDTLIYPLGLYGCEAAPVHDGALAKLASTVARAIGPYSQRSSTTLAGLLLTPGRNLTPDYQVLYRSLSLLRRIIAKHPQVTTAVQAIFNSYLQQAKPGTIEVNTCPCPKQPAPPPGQGSRAAWNHSHSNLGPIGLLISRLHCNAAYINRNMLVLAHPYFKFDFLNCAKQHLRKHVDDLVTAALSRTTAMTRSTFTEAGTLDKATYFRAMQKQTEEVRTILQRVHVQAHWTDELQDKFFEDKDHGTCPLCKQEKGTLLHPWTCPSLAEFRESHDPDLARLNPSNTPPHVLLGIPDQLTAGNTGWLVKPRGGTDLCREVMEVLKYDVDSRAVIQTAVHNHCDAAHAIDVQQLSYKLLANEGKTELPSIQNVGQTAPSRPNVFSDGSLPYPGTALSIATFWYVGARAHSWTNNPRGAHFL